jgi:uncharacterized protein (DUF4415 family)
MKQSEVPPLTQQDMAELKRAAAKPENEIDCSDIPEMTDEMWVARRVQNPFYRPLKVHASLRIDADVMAWFKQQGKGYQSKINAVLRDAMTSSIATQK